MEAVAKSRCTCGATVLWKADEPQSDEWLMVAKPDMPADLNDIKLMLRATTDAAFCANCGRLWVAWQGADRPAEYVPVDPSVRPVRPG
jgi:hypothetical protein